MAIAILSLLARAFDAANAGAWVPVALLGLAIVWLGRNAASSICSNEPCNKGGHFVQGGKP